MTVEKHIAGTGMTKLAWARSKGIPKDGLYRHLRGKPVDFETAERLSEATRGKVRALDIYRTGRPEK